jgi:chromosome segregation ATPase
MKAAQNRSTNWESERAELIAERDQLMQLLSETEEAAAIALERQIATAVDRVREELSAENNKLRKELEASAKAAKEWSAERTRLVSESERSAQMLSGSDEAAAIALERQIATAVERSRADLNAKLSAQKEEHQRALAEIEGNRSGKFHKEMTAVVANVRAELEADAGKLRKEIAALKGERDQAKMQLADLQNEHSHCKGAAESSIANMQAEVTRLRDELSHEQQLVAESERLAAEREQTNKLLADAVDKHREELTETQKSASETGKRELEAAAQKVRDEMKAEQDELMQIWESERSKLAKEIDRVSAAAAQRERERDQLQKDLDVAMQLLNDAQPSDGKSGDGVDLDLIREETARVEQSLQAIIKAIEDPSAELSVVVRKNVERAQLDSYLQGLRFAAGIK